MLSKCANPACPARFLYLHDGKIFNVEVELIPAFEDTADSGLGLPRRRLEHYWLCGNCSQTMVVVCEHGQVVTRLARVALKTGTRGGVAHAA